MKISHMVRVMNFGASTKPQLHLVWARCVVTLAPQLAQAALAIAQVRSTFVPRLARTTFTSAITELEMSK